jgi:hypothetical protein
MGLISQFYIKAKEKKQKMFLCINKEDQILYILEEDLTEERMENLLALAYYDSAHTFTNELDRVWGLQGFEMLLDDSKRYNALTQYF